MLILVMLILLDLVEDRKKFFWLKTEGQNKLATENLVPGNQVYNEKLLSKNGIEYRIWNPFRSKLAASIMNRLEEFPFKKNSSVLYLGVSTGTTASHISDIVGMEGTKQYFTRETKCTSKGN